jgi:hypothetical protein
LVGDWKTDAKRVGMHHLLGSEVSAAAAARTDCGRHPGPEWHMPGTQNFGKSSKKYGHVADVVRGAFR